MTTMNSLYLFQNCRKEVLIGCGVSCVRGSYQDSSSENLLRQSDHLLESLRRRAKCRCRRRASF